MSVASKVAAIIGEFAADQNDPFFAKPRQALAEIVARLDVPTLERLHSRLVADEEEAAGVVEAVEAGRRALLAKLEAEARDAGAAYAPPDPLTDKRIGAIYAALLDRFGNPSALRRLAASSAGQAVGAIGFRRVAVGRRLEELYREGKAPRPSAQRDALAETAKHEATIAALNVELREAQKAYRQTHAEGTALLRPALEKRTQELTQAIAEAAEKRAAAWATAGRYSCVAM